jgi:hypothetical protein
MHWAAEGDPHTKETEENERANGHTEESPPVRMVMWLGGITKLTPRLPWDA